MIFFFRGNPEHVPYLLQSSNTFPKLWWQSLNSRKAYKAGPTCWATAFSSRLTLYHPPTSVPSGHCSLVILKQAQCWAIVFVFLFVWNVLPVAGFLSFNSLSLQFKCYFYKESFPKEPLSRCLSLYPAPYFSQHLLLSRILSTVTLIRM